ncbi:protein translocase subunit SecF [Rhodobium gokarnense]|uniref:Protein-export membrane protein SecF n=1 Tax=Rhodobium gokarnense TaxID=364296 RepID=A0ABT3HFP3_9HYPH|nr:protein translocase subunit SecF [Rhodobium gokarnense]MCW2309217.1 preprotein translocase SecF subunit [Rhodobium gokarnense]
MRYLRLIPDDTKLRFMTYRWIAFPVSITAMIASLVLFAILGLNLGIDFKGGSLIEIRTIDGPADIGAIRSSLGELNLGDVQVQEFGAPDDVLIRIEDQEGGEAAQQRAVTLIRGTLGEEGVEYRRVEVVGPRVSGELAEAGTIAVVVALFAVLLYIWFRFEWQFALGAVAATIHDVVLTIGMFSVLRLDFTLASIAAILTIVGYSLNDTVVVYDRVRENLRRYKKMPLPQLLDLSINNTLSRTVLTSLTTLLALFALFIFGGEVIRSFVFAMIWGIFVGTYSSIFIAAPLLIHLKLKRGGSKDGGAETAETAEAT